MATTKWELLVSGEELASVAKERCKEYVEETFDKSEESQKIAEGWTIKKENKRSLRMVKPKKIGDAFEDELWAVFYQMGFSVMNSSNKFKLFYTDELSKQLDIVAIDDETCLFVECKEAENEGTRKSFDHEISEISGKRDRLFSAIKEKFPNRKCRYIFATKKYILGDQDKNRLRDYNIPYFEYSAVLYYRKLSEYLGKAARFQLLGFLFAGQRILGMDSTVPAIRGFMPGGIKYYTFLIEPEKLLKLGYVLHRTNANNDYSELLPSYQRLIKKDRLESVRNFVNEGGYFPNSVIISVETKNEMQFDLASGNESRLYKMGFLHLPQTYQSAYIIDGQHRIYGYSDSNHSSNNTIPVVAFENLNKDKQLKLFMDINQNQKAISPKLRGLLEIDVYYNDPNANLRKTALLGKIAKRLGEDSKSPLKGRVVIGEDAQTSICCITMEYIKAALDKTGFFNSYKKNGTVISQGLFERPTNDETMDIVYPLLLRFFSDISEYSTEWGAEDSYLTKNNSIVALIRILGDFVGIVCAENPELTGNTEALYKEISDRFLLDTVDALDTMPAEKRSVIRQTKGADAQTKPYRTVQMAIHEKNSRFTNDDIERYYDEHVVDNNDLAKSELVAIRKILSEEVKRLFGNDNWQFNHMSEEHQKDFTTRINNKRIANQRNGNNQEIDVWEELTILDLQKIITFGSHWSNSFKNYFEEKGLTTGKDNFVQTMKTLSEQQTNITNGVHVTKTNFETIHKLYTALKGEES